MKRAGVMLLAAGLLAGCATAPGQEVRTVRTLRYERMVVFPFIEGTEEQRTVARQVFIDALSKFPDINIVGKEKVDGEFLDSLRLLNPDSFGPLDFSANPEGDKRRQRVAEAFDADAMIFGYFFSEGHELALYIQFQDIDDGSVNLGFSREVEVLSGKEDEAVRNLATKCAAHVVEHIYDNVDVTRFIKY